MQKTNLNFKNPNHGLNENILNFFEIKQKKKENPMKTSFNLSKAWKTFLKQFT